MRAALEIAETIVVNGGIVAACICGAVLYYRWTQQRRR